MTHTTEDYNQTESHSQELNLHLINKRQIVLSALTKSGKALSAYELIDFCKVEFNLILHPMTVYRALEFFECEHLVHKLSSINKFIACTHTTGEHEHEHEHDIVQFLICKKCHKVDEISIQKSTLDDLHHNVSHAGFHFVSSQLEVACICKPCHESFIAKGR